ncbi:protein translocase subunit [Entomophthora muscae]|uniref:Protein translocase subunit n=1 Tax=Entomophthora muscae TaxID=34485 RepID=A0ACC2U5Z5_9FUNG|nr:protein translocase subunit [Entomophthora muscae]
MALFGSSNSNNQKQQIMDQVKSELAMANAQELISKLNDKCYSKCIPVPGSELSLSEQTCVSKCIDRYIEAWNKVSEVYLLRVQKESQK